MADGDSGPGDRDRSGDGPLRPDAFEDRVGSETASQLPHALVRFLAALADDVGRAELFRQRHPVRVAAHDDDLLGAKTLRSDHPHRPTAPSPTTATLWPGATFAVTSA